MNALVRNASPRLERGIGFVPLLFYLVVAAVVLLIGLKLVPLYIDLLSIKKVIAGMATGEDLKSATVSEIRRSFDRRASIDNIKMLKSDDLEISKEGGETVISATWEQRVPLFKGFTLLVEFSVNSTDK